MVHDRAWRIWGESSCDVTSRTKASAVPVTPITLSEHRSLFAAQVFRWGSTVNRFLFLSTISSTSSDSEMSFDSEDSEIYYNTEENDDSIALINIAK